MIEFRSPNGPNGGSHWEFDTPAGPAEVRMVPAGDKPWEPLYFAARTLDGKFESTGMSRLIACGLLVKEIEAALEGAA